MGNREVWKVVPLDEMSPRDMDFARRQGIIKDPDFGGMNPAREINLAVDAQKRGWVDLGTDGVLPAANIRSRHVSGPPKNKSRRNYIK